jgi:hypothetical protein
MIRTRQMLRLDSRAWNRLTEEATVAGAAAVTIGAFAIFVWDRSGLQAVVAPRASFRLVLIGFYGWVGLTLAIGAVARFVRGINVRSGVMGRLVGLAHFPLFVLAIVIQGAAVALQVQGPGLVMAVFVFAFWMPAQLVAATRAAYALETGEAMLVVGGPYLLWSIVVGGALMRQVGHLL